MNKLIPIVLILPMFLLGCANPPTRTLDGPLGLTFERTTPANTAILGDDHWIASYLGVEPSQVLADESGLNIQTAGVGTAGSIRNVTTFWSPGDVTLNNASATLPDGTVLTIESFTSSNSAVIAAYNARVDTLATLLRSLSADEATRYIESLRETRLLTEDIIQSAILRAFPGNP